MKTTIFTVWTSIAVLAGMVGSSCAEAPAMRDAANHDQLVLKLRQAQQDDPMKHMSKAKGADPAAVYKPKDILSQSDIIAFQGLATLVPKCAILRIPKNYKDRIAMQPGAQIVSWADFYAANRGWITIVEVSRTQAEGNLALPDETRKQITKNGNLVVATFLGGPISVLPLKKPEKTGGKTSEDSDTKVSEDTGAKEPATTDTQKP